MGKTAKEYILSILHWWWVMAIGFFGAIIGVTLDIKQDCNIPIWIWVAIGVISLFVAQLLAFHKVRMERDSAKADIDVIMKKLRDFTVTINDKRINSATILRKLQPELLRGIAEYETGRAITGIFGGNITSEQLIATCNEVFDKLSLWGVVQLEQRRRSTGPRTSDMGYWVLTELGKDIILYLEANPQVLHNEDSRN